MFARHGGLAVSEVNFHQDSCQDIGKPSPDQCQWYVYIMGDVSTNFTEAFADYLTVLPQGMDLNT